MSANPTSGLFPAKVIYSCLLVGSNPTTTNWCWGSDNAPEGREKKKDNSSFLKQNLKGSPDNLERI
jgi:hypothetical protein